MSDFDDRSLVVGRRRFLAGGLSLLVASGLPPRGARASAGLGRRLTMFNLHTAEHADVEYFDGRALVPAAIAELQRILRDFRTGDIHWIDPGLLDLAWAIARASGVSRPTFEIVSGYRSPATNALLHERSGGVALRSLHLEGKAIDLRLRGLPTERLRDLAVSLQRGGVGFYAVSNFVHIDTGRVRRW